LAPSNFLSYAFRKKKGRREFECLTLRGEFKKKGGKGKGKGRIFALISLIGKYLTNTPNTMKKEKRGSSWENLRGEKDALPALCTKNQFGGAN